MSDSISYAVLVAATLFLGIGLQIAWSFFSNFLKGKRLESRMSDASVAIGKNAKNPENEAYALNYLKEKFSSERFENRITDALGLVILAVHTLLSLMITVWYFAMIAGRIFGFMDIEPIILWAPMILQLLLSIAILIFSVFIKIIFGRYPGEAKGFNKEFIKTIK
ncbi:TPA: superinfection exclusion protein A [Yersinia enterocolitica]|nr:superinfection exclusion protein A [Yersinia enterocolitica]HDL6982541.1 superinfection exclusion protein A [Yersinia enterocolitica]HDL7066360.1 superinfection exclusion protein A [Yersinia enterocolitica]HDL7070745.1 superinfection exclusion protein A [Yersinia enterocolitica]